MTVRHGSVTGARLAAPPTLDEIRGMGSFNSRRIPIPSTLAKLSASVEALAAKKQALADKTMLLEAEIAAHKKRFVDDVAEHIGNEAGRSLVKPTLQQDHDSWARAKRREAEESLYADLAEVNSLQASIDAATPMFADPLSLLQSKGLGSERRSRLYSELKDYGPVALRAIAARATAENDAELAAVVTVLNSALPKNSRVLDNPQSWAENFVGAELTSATLLLRQSKAHSLEAHERVRSASTVGRGAKPSAVSTVAKGLRKAEDEAIASAFAGSD